MIRYCLRIAQIVCGFAVAGSIIANAGWLIYGVLYGLPLASAEEAAESFAILGWLTSLLVILWGLSGVLAPFFPKRTKDILAEWEAEEAA